MCLQMLGDAVSSWIKVPNSQLDWFLVHSLGLPQCIFMMH